MIIEEINNVNSIVRIHDEYCEPSFENKLEQCSKIISNSYKHRTANNTVNGTNGTLEN